MGSGLICDRGFLNKQMLQQASQFLYLFIFNKLWTLISYFAETIARTRSILITSFSVLGFRAYAQPLSELQRQGFKAQGSSRERETQGGMHLLQTRHGGKGPFLREALLGERRWKVSLCLKVKKTLFPVFWSSLSMNIKVIRFGKEKI